jgi:nucleotide-binding universal stress UspA family protein
MKTILAATDFSKAAENACNYAAAMSVALECELLLFHCYVPPTSISEIPLTVDIDEASAGLERNLNAEAERLRKTYPALKSIRTNMRMGFVIQELKNVIKEFEPELVVMGRHGISNLEKFLFGSQAVHAMRDIDTPLLIIPPHDKYEKIESLAAAVDFSDLRKTFPADKLKKFLRLTGLNKVQVVNSGPADKFDPDIVFGTQLIGQLMEPFQTDIYFISAGKKDMEQSILEFIQKNSISMLLVVPRHLSFFERITHRSESEQLAWHTAVPLLSMHK